MLAYDTDRRTSVTSDYLLSISEDILRSSVDAQTGWEPTIEDQS